MWPAPVGAGLAKPDAEWATVLPLFIAQLAFGCKASRENPAERAPTRAGPEAVLAPSSVVSRFVDNCRSGGSAERYRGAVHLQFHICDRPASVCDLVPTAGRQPFRFRSYYSSGASNHGSDSFSTRMDFALVAQGRLRSAAGMRTLHVDTSLSEAESPDRRKSVSRPCDGTSFAQERHSAARSRFVWLSWYRKSPAPPIWEDATCRVFCRSESQTRDSPGLMSTGSDFFHALSTE